MLTVVRSISPGTTCRNLLPVRRVSCLSSLDTRLDRSVEHLPVLLHGRNQDGGRGESRVVSLPEFVVSLPLSESFGTASPEQLCQLKMPPKRKATGALEEERGAKKSHGGNDLGQGRPKSKVTRRASTIQRCSRRGSSRSAIFSASDSSQSQSRPLRLRAYQRHRQQQRDLHRRPRSGPSEAGSPEGADTDGDEV